MLPYFKIGTSTCLWAVCFKLFVNLVLFYIYYSTARSAIFRLFCKMIYFVRFFFLYLFFKIIMYVSLAGKNLLQILQLNNIQINFHISNQLWSRFLLVDSQTHQRIKCFVTVNFLFKCVILEQKKYEIFQL